MVEKRELKGKTKKKEQYDWWQFRILLLKKSSHPSNIECRMGENEMKNKIRLICNKVCKARKIFVAFQQQSET